MTKNNIEYQTIKKSYIGDTKARRFHKGEEIKIPSLNSIACTGQYRQRISTMSTDLFFLREIFKQSLSGQLNKRFFVKRFERNKKNQFRHDICGKVYMFESLFKDVK
jgi:hypothetical protein